MEPAVPFKPVGPARVNGGLANPSFLSKSVAVPQKPLLDIGSFCVVQYRLIDAWVEMQRVLLQVVRRSQALDGPKQVLRVGHDEGSRARVEPSRAEVVTVQEKRRFVGHLGRDHVHLTRAHPMA